MECFIVSLTSGKGINSCFYFFLQDTELSAPSQLSADNRIAFLWYKQSLLFHKISNVYVNPLSADSFKRRSNLFSLIFKRKVY